MTGSGRPWIWHWNRPTPPSSARTERGCTWKSAIAEDKRDRERQITLTLHTHIKVTHVNAIQNTTIWTLKKNNMHTPSQKAVCKSNEVGQKGCIWAFQSPTNVILELFSSSTSQNKVLENTKCWSRQLIIQDPRSDVLWSHSHIRSYKFIWCCSKNDNTVNGICGRSLNNFLLSVCSGIQYQTSLKVGNSTGSSLSHFALQNAPHILYWRQVGTAGRPVKYPYPLPPQPGLCNVCRMWFCIVLLKYAWTSLEKMSSWRQHIVLQNLYVFFSINGAITEVQVTFAKGTDTTPYHDRPWLLDLLLVTVWMILFFFGPEHTASIPSKKYLKYWFIWPQYTFPLCDGPSQMPPSPEKSTALLDTVNIGLHFGTVQF